MDKGDRCIQLHLEPESISDFSGCKGIDVSKETIMSDLQLNVLCVFCAHILHILHILKIYEG